VQLRLFGKVLKKKNTHTKAFKSPLAWLIQGSPTFGGRGGDDSGILIIRSEQAHPQQPTHSVEPMLFLRRATPGRERQSPRMRLVRRDNLQFTLQQRYATIRGSQSTPTKACHP